MRPQLGFALVVVALWVVSLSALCEARAKNLTPGVDRILSDSRLSDAVKEKMMRKVIQENENVGAGKAQKITERDLQNHLKTEKGEVKRVRQTHGKQQRRDWQDVPRPTPIRNIEAPVKFDSTVFAYREQSLKEESMTNQIWGEIAEFRMSDMADFFANAQPVLNEMGFNISLAAAEVYNGFGGVTWVEQFRELIICDLDLTLFRSQRDGGLLFDSPTFCVQDVTYAALAGDGEDDLFALLLDDYEDTLLDEDYKIISGACAKPMQPRYEEESEFDYYCFIWFVKMSTDLNSNNCICTSTAGNCCTRQLNPHIFYFD